MPPFIEVNIFIMESDDDMLKKLKETNPTAFSRMGMG